jgi:HemK-related putative methylase
MYKPREDSFLLEKYVKKLAFGKVLDIGTGSGIQIEAALKNKKVNSALASDLDKDIISKLKGKKYKVVHSDLFSNIKGKYDTIIFNPPYLPDSKYDKGKSLGGGKKGYELLVRFLNEVSAYLTQDGIVLIVFSSITNRKIIDKEIKNNLLEYELLEKQGLFFEILYIYKIKKSDMLKILENVGIKNVKFFASGHRGIIYRGMLNNEEVGIKIKKPESRAVNRICNEVEFLGILNNKGIGPKLIISMDNFFVYKFVKGKFILDYFENCSDKEKREIIKKILLQMYKMDKLKINKEEMHHPLKHIIIKNKKPVLIDFERCYYTEKPHNVTQFIQFIFYLNKTFKLSIDKRKLMDASRDYKNEYSKEKFEKILSLID